jgi:PKD repeat protein
VDVDWGDGSATTSFTTNAVGSLGTTSHTYDDNGSYTVTVTVTDKDGDSDSASFTATVANVAPSVTSAAFANESVGCGASNATLDVSFADPGADAWSASINWGDGTPTQTVSGVSRTFSVSHTYAASGPYTATVTISDDDGGSSAPATAHVNVNYLVVGGGLLQPINPGPPNSIFKYGSTIPVKIKLQSCNGSIPGTLVIRVTYQKLDGSTPTGDVNEPYSQSQADTGNQMRFTGSPDNQYIFNMATKSFSDAQATYRLYVTIEATGQVVTADIGLKK